MKLSRLICTLTLASAWLPFGNAPVHAQEAENLVRTHLVPATVAVGESATLYVEILTTSFFTAAPELPVLDVPGAVVQLSDERAPHLNETIDGETWFGLQHQYRITPIVAAPLAIPALTIAVHPGPGGKPVVVHGPARTLTVTAPEGAGDAFVTHDLRITQQIDAGQTLKVGDTVTRTIHLRALGTPAMFIPPLPVSDVPGTRSYRQAPQLEDVSTPRVSGSRTEVTSYLLQRQGSITIPGASMTWWNLDTRALQTATIPAVTFQVAAAPPPQAPFTAAQRDAVPEQEPQRSPRRMLIIAGLVLLGLLALWLAILFLRRIGPRLDARRRARRAAYLASEPAAFRDLQKTMRERDPHQTLTALYRWLDRMPGVPTPARTQWLSTLDARLLQHCEVLVVTAYTADYAEDVRRAIHGMERSLPPARRRWLHRRSGASEPRPLGPLNVS